MEKFQKIRDPFQKGMGCDFLSTCEANVTDYYFRDYCLSIHNCPKCGLFAERIKKLKKPKEWLTIYVIEEEKKKEKANKILESP